MSYQVAKIKNTFGYKGQLRVISETDFERFTIGSEFYTFDLDNQKVFLKIESVSKNAKEYIITFSNINLDIANKLKGCILYTDLKPELKENEYHYQELINMPVYDDLNNYLGKVINIIFNVNQQILEVLIEKTNKNKLIPFTLEYVLVKENKIIITPIEGLL